MTWAVNLTEDFNRMLNVTVDSKLCNAQTGQKTEKSN